MTTRFKPLLVLFAAACLVGLAGLAPQQPDAQPSREGQPAVRRPGDANRPRTAQTNDPAQYRQTLQRRLDAGRRMQQHLEEAMAQLDAGKDLAEVRRTLDQQTRESFRSMMGEMGPRPGDEHDGPGGPPGTGTGAGRPGEPGPQGPPGRGPQALSKEEREQLKELLRSERPALLAQLESLASAEPRAAERILSGIGGRFRGLRELKDRDPAQFKLRLDELQNSADIMQRTRDYMAARNQNADPQKLEAAKASLRQAIAEQFELRITSLRRQIEEWKQRAAKLQEEIDKQGEARERLIDEHLNRILKPAERKRTEKTEKGEKDARPGENKQ